MDTSASYREVADYYYIFEPVKQVNSPENEWCLSFMNPKKAILTFTDTDLNKVMIVRVPAENYVTMESGMGIPLEGNIGAMSVKGDKVVFASAPSDGMIGNADLYTAKLNGNLLTNLNYMGSRVHESVLTWESHPAYSPDGDVVFFASDRYHGTGEIDIWFTVKLPDGEWSEPVNCGDMVNSNCDELTPFVTNDGKNLFFASSGHKGVGGYDIFRSEISDLFWKDVKEGNYNRLFESGGYFSEAVNLRPPLNTPADELFPSTPVDYEDLLYYSSNQAEHNASILSTKGGFDLYLRKKIVKHEIAKDKIPDETDNFDGSIDITENYTEEFPEIYLPTYKLKGVIYNARTKEPAKNAEVVIREIASVLGGSYAGSIINDTSGKYDIVELEKDREFEITAQAQDLSFESFKIKIDKKDTVIVVKANDGGEYIVELEKDREFEITAQAQDLFFESFKLRVDKVDTTTVVDKSFFIPEQLHLRVNFPTANFDDPYKYVLDSNGVEINTTWEEEMDLLAKNILISQIYIKKIKLIGHTDEVGTAKNNKILGQNRVDFVVSELVKRGVPKDILEAESAGESSPLARRDGESTELYRKRLRRVEIQKILN